MRLERLSKLFLIDTSSTFIFTIAPWILLFSDFCSEWLLWISESIFEISVIHVDLTSLHWLKISASMTLFIWLKSLDYFLVYINLFNDLKYLICLIVDKLFKCYICFHFISIYKINYKYITKLNIII